MADDPIAELLDAADDMRTPRRPRPVDCVRPLLLRWFAWIAPVHAVGGLALAIAIVLSDQTLRFGHDSLGRVSEMLIAVGLATYGILCVCLSWGIWTNKGWTRHVLFGASPLCMAATIVISSLTADEVQPFHVVAFAIGYVTLMTWFCYGSPRVAKFYESQEELRMYKLRQLVAAED